MTKKKTAMFGGSFDPVHLGHLFLLHKAVESTSYERFVIVPAYMSNFKQDKYLSATPEQRLEMMKLALEDYRKIYRNDRPAEFVVSDEELSRQGVSYTYDTVVSIRERYNLTDRLGMLIGDDHLERLSQWYRFEELKDIVTFIICPRENEKPNWSLIPNGCDYIALDTERLAPESATRVRDNIDAFMTDLPEKVRDYVRKNNLYRS